MSRIALAATLVLLTFATPVAAAPQPDPAVQLLQAQPGNDGLAVAVARQALAKQDPATALQVLDACIRAPGSHQQALSERGWIHYHQGRTAEALADLRAATAKPGDALALGRLAWVLAEAGQRHDAIQTALAARRLPAPEGKPLALLTLGAVADSDERGREYLREALTLTPSPWPAYWLGRRSQGEDAFAAYADALARSLASTDPFERQMQARVQGALRQLIADHPALSAAWIKQLEALLAKHPGEQALSEALIDAYRRAGQPEFAIAELRRRLGVDADKAQLLRRIAEAHADLEQYQLALGSYERALQVAPAGSDTALLLRCDRAGLLLQMGRDADALAELNGLLKDKPEFRRAKLLKGLALALKRQWREAGAALSGLSAVGPDEALLINFVRRQEGKPTNWPRLFSGSAEEPTPAP